MVGLFMMKEVRRINFDDLQEAFPAFIIMVMIALSYNISTGLAFGFVGFVVIRLLSGRGSEVRAAMWLIAGLCVLYLTMDKLPQWLSSLRGWRLHS